MRVADGHYETAEVRAMKPTGIIVTADELESVKVAQDCSGMFLSGGMPMGDPQREVARLVEKYHPPEGAGLNIKTGEFMLPDRGIS